MNQIFLESKVGLLQGPWRPENRAP